MAFGGAAIDFDALFGGEDDPVFVDAGFGVEVGIGAIQSCAGDSNLDDQLRGSWMGFGVVLLGAASNGDVRLRLGVEKCERLLFPDGEAFRKAGEK